jgi:hypothetical protein
MFDQYHFTGGHFGAYVLMRLPTFETPWPPSYRWKQLEPSEGARFVHRCVTETHFDWRLLHFLGIEEHPANLHPGELKREIDDRLDQTHARFVVYQRVDEPKLLVPKRSTVSVPVDTDAIAPDTRMEAQDLDWVDIQFVDDAGEPMANETYEVILADGSTRTGTLDANGVGKLSGIIAGGCAVSFPSFRPRLAS